MSNEKWVVHIVGPDDVIDQPDEITALREANALNKVIDIQGSNCQPNAPHVVALAKNVMIEEL